MPIAGCPHPSRATTPSRGRGNRREREPSRSGPLVMPQHPAQPLAADDLSGAWRRCSRHRQRPVLHRLVRPLGVIVLDVLAADVVQVLPPEDDELVKAFLLDRLHEPLYIRVLVRRAVLPGATVPNGQARRQQISGCLRRGEYRSADPRQGPGQQCGEASLQLRSRSPLWTACLGPSESSAPTGWVCADIPQGAAWRISPPCRDLSKSDRRCTLLRI